MGDHRQSLTHNHHTEAEGRSGRGPDDDGLALQSAVRESPGSKDPKYQDLDGGGLGFQDQEEEIPPEELAGEEFLDDRAPGEAILQLESVLDKDEKEAVPEMRWHGGGLGCGEGAACPHPAHGPGQCRRLGPPGAMWAAPSLVSEAKSANTTCLDSRWVTMGNPTTVPILESDSVQMAGLRGQERWPPV